MQRTALIIGATGLVGNSLLTQLGSLYQKVIIIARSQPKGLSDSMHFYQLKDFNQMHEFVSALSIGKDTDAFSCLGTTIKQRVVKPPFDKSILPIMWHLQKLANKKA